MKLDNPKMARVEKMVRVEWLDSLQPNPNWLCLTDLEIRPPAPCVSVGWLICYDGGKVVIAPTLADIDSDHQQVSGLIVIPKCCVVSVTDLRAEPLSG